MSRHVNNSKSAPKGQVISEWNFGDLNFPKKDKEKNWWSSALDYKKLSNKKNALDNLNSP